MQILVIQLYNYGACDSAAVKEATFVAEPLRIIYYVCMYSNLRHAKEHEVTHAVRHVRRQPRIDLVQDIVSRLAFHRSHRGQDRFRRLSDSDECDCSELL